MRLFWKIQKPRGTIVTRTAEANAQVPPPNARVSVSKSQGARQSRRLTRVNLGLVRVCMALPLSSVLLIVLFIVCLCWLMVQCYVRREERLPQAQAGHTVNPSTQPYWLTKVQPQHADTHSHTHKQTVSAHFLQTCLQIPTVCSSPSASTGPLFGLSATVWCVRVAGMAILCSHWAAIIAGVCLACAPRVGFIPLHQAGGVYWNSPPPLLSHFSLLFFPPTIFIHTKRGLCSTLPLVSPLYLSQEGFQPEPLLNSKSALKS